MQKEEIYKEKGQKKKEEIYKEEGQKRRIEVNNGDQKPKRTVHIDRTNLLCTHIIFIVYWLTHSYIQLSQDLSICKMYAYDLLWNPLSRGAK